MDKFRKSALALLAVLLGSLIVYPTLSQVVSDVSLELDCEVTSTTTLWNPGTHSFEMTCNGTVLAPFSETFTMNGSGTTTYAIVGGTGYPPGEFVLNMTLSGYLENSFFNGPYTLSLNGSGETIPRATSPGYVRTEEALNVTAKGTFNGLPLNVTSTSHMVDFSFIGPEGKEFEFRVTGTSHLSIIPELPSILTLLLLMTLTIAALFAIGARDRLRSTL